MEDVRETTISRDDIRGYEYRSVWGYWVSQSRGTFGDAKAVMASPLRVKSDEPLNLMSWRRFCEFSDLMNLSAGHLGGFCVCPF